MIKESVTGKTHVFFLEYFAINQLLKCNVMVPIIHTPIIGTMKI